MAKKHMKVRKNASTKRPASKKPASKSKVLPKRPASRRLRQAVLRSHRLWSTNPGVLANAQKELYVMQRMGEIRTSEIFRIFESPVSTTRMIAKLRSFMKGKKSFQQLMAEVNRAYKNQVPHEVVQRALDCKQGRFSAHLDRINQAYEPPNSFATGLTVRKLYHEIRKAEHNKRPRRLQRMQELVKLANELKTEIHNAASQRYHAIERVNAAMAKKGVLPFGTELEVAKALLQENPQVQIDIDIAQKSKTSLHSLERAFRANVINKL